MTSLTTDLGNLFPEENLLDKATNKSSCGKANTVVSKLVINWRQLNSAECNVSFFHNLLSKNISTRDIHSFVKKQAGLKKIHKNLDKPLTRRAMRSKLNDACAFINRQKRIVFNLKKELLTAVGMKRYLHRRMLKQIRTKLSQEKKVQLENDLKKVQRYESLQAQMDREIREQNFMIPASIQQFKEIKAFKTPQEVQNVQEPPVVYDPTIILSKDEENLLSKGPGFSVRQTVSCEDFKVELEKMVCKQKYGDSSDEIQPTQPQSLGFNHSRVSNLSTEIN